MRNRMKKILPNEISRSHGGHDNFRMMATLDISSRATALCIQTRKMENEVTGGKQDSEDRQQGFSARALRQRKRERRKRIEEAFSEAVESVSLASSEVREPHSTAKNSEFIELTPPPSIQSPLQRTSSWRNDEEMNEDGAHELWSKLSRLLTKPAQSASAGDSAIYENDAGSALAATSDGVDTTAAAFSIESSGIDTPNNLVSLLRGVSESLGFEQDSETSIDDEIQVNVAGWEYFSGAFDDTEIPSNTKPRASNTQELADVEPGLTSGTTGGDNSLDKKTESSSHELGKDSNNAIPTIVSGNIPNDESSLRSMMDGDIEKNRRIELQPFIGYGGLDLPMWLGATPKTQSGTHNDIDASDESSTKMTDTFENIFEEIPAGGEEKVGRRRTTLVSKIIFILIVVVLATICGFLYFFVLNTKSSSDENLNPVENVQVPTSPPSSDAVAIGSTEIPTTSPSFDMTAPTQSVSSLLRSLILNTGVTMAEALDDTLSPQALAFQWLLQSNIDMPNWRILQRYALVTFYYSTDGPNWRRQDGWLTNEAECEWFFRTSEPCRDGELLHLSLVFNDLGGLIPAEIGLFSSLERIMLRTEFGNQVVISGDIPSSLARCTSLELLHMQHQSLTGILDDNLVQMWPNLTSVDLSGNELSGTLPPSLGSMEILNRLSLAGNTFTGSIPKSYGSFQGTLLDLEVNQLTGSFPSGTLSGIRWLGLENNQLTNLPSVFNAPRLRSFRAGNNTIEGRLPEFQGLWSTGSIEEILLSENRFTGTIPRSWVMLNGLGTLDLSGNELTGAVPSRLTNSSKLKVLRIQRNSITEIECWDWEDPEWVADCGTSFGSPQEIQCSCCSRCCTDGQVCKLGD